MPATKIACCENFTSEITSTNHLPFHKDASYIPDKHQKTSSISNHLPFYKDASYIPDKLQKTSSLYIADKLQKTSSFKKFRIAFSIKLLATDVESLKMPV